MALQPFPVTEFGGLNLQLDPQEVGPRVAIDMLNVDLLNQRTKIATRGGLSLFATGTATYHILADYAVAKGSLLAGRNTGAGLVFTDLSSGSANDTTAAYGGASTRAVQIQATNVPGTTFFLITSRTGSTNENMRQMITTTLGVADAGHAPRYVAISPIDERLVVAHFSSAGSSPSGANGSTSSVFFSDPGVISGATASFGANNWLKLAPHDSGEEIAGLCAWRELLFVVKRSKLFVFYSTSTDASGNPVFNYRVINLPSNTRVTQNRGGECMVAGGDGVYLLLNDGIYRTTGDVPRRVSDTVTPLFDGTGPSDLTLPTSGDWNFSYAANRVYLNYLNGSDYRTLIYDALLGEWLMWDMSAGQSALPTNVVEHADANDLPRIYIAASAKLLLLSQTATTDDGTAISSSYQSGFYELGQTGADAFTRWTRLWGYGSPTVSVFTDMGSSDSNAAAVTLGTAPAVAEAYHLKSYKGRLFSHKISATSGAWGVSRMQHDVSWVRP